MTRRLYLYTGKGGVGKTTLALAMAQFLSENGHNVEYYFFKDHSFIKNQYEKKEYNEFKFKKKFLRIEDTCKEYIQEKLNYEVISKWIVNANFFKALLNILPGLMYLIYLGKIIKELNNDPQKIIVLDSPASGHFLTMMESVWNFHQIFGSGSLFKDTKKIIDFFSQKNNYLIQIITLTNQVNVNESIDLKRKLAKISDFEQNLILNYCFSPLFQNIHDCDLSYLKHKMKIEKHVSETQNIHPVKIPYSILINETSMISQLSKFCGKLI